MITICICKHIARKMCILQEVQDLYEKGRGGAFVQEMHKGDHCFDSLPAILCHMCSQYVYE